MKTLKLKIDGKTKEFHIAEWKDIAPLVERHLVEHREFYAELAKM